MITLERTIPVPPNRRLHVDMEAPEAWVGGLAQVVISFAEPSAPSAPKSLPASASGAGIRTMTPEAALQKLFGCCEGSGDTLDAYMERHWADNDLERNQGLRKAPTGIHLQTPD
jgi:hypothetical protein